MCHYYFLNAQGSEKKKKKKKYIQLTLIDLEKDLNNKRE